MADAIAATWTQHFVKLGIAGEQVGQAGALLQSWATILGAMLMKMADTVARAESIIAMLEAARPVLEFFKINVEAEISSIKAEARAEVVAISAAASEAISGAGVPAWATQPLALQTQGVVAPPTAGPAVNMDIPAGPGAGHISEARYAAWLAGDITVDADTRGKLAARWEQSRGGTTPNTTGEP